MTPEEKRKRQSEYQKAHYQKKKQYYKDRAEERRQKVRKEFEELKSTLACEKCGENHVACLDFHHKDPTEKDTEVSVAVHRSWGRERIEKEISKCIVLCSNCHRKLHYEERNAVLA